MELDERSAFFRGHLPTALLSPRYHLGNTRRFPDLPVLCGKGRLTRPWSGMLSSLDQDAGILLLPSLALSLMPSLQ